MKLVYLGAISTGVIVVLSIALVIPAFTQRPYNIQLVMLSITIKDSPEVSQWCDDLSVLFRTHEVKATVFVSGQLAEANSDCISALAENQNLDIGSQTYSYANLTAIPDYMVALDEVSQGKIAVDSAGNLDSRLFKAPFDATDENIYSLLNRSGILADFSYKSQYNKYYNGQFIKFDLRSYEFPPVTSDLSFIDQTDQTPVMINVDNSKPIENIESLVVKLQQKDITIVNASELTGMDLTLRRGDQE